MKIIIYSMLLSWICMACVDALEMTPENSITFMNAFETEKELETSVLTTESVLRNRMTASTYGLIGYGEYSDYHYSYDYALLLEHDPAGYTIPWSDDYEVISHANVPLPYIDKINMPQERRDYYKGQLYFFKAFAYLDLIRRWGDCVLIRDQVEFEAQGQTPWPKVADYAINLAKEAVRLLPEWDELKDANGNPVTHRARPCKGAANALLANLCAWKAGCKYMAKLEDRDYDEQELWKTAEQACTDIIKREDIYQLASTPEDVCTSVLVGGSKESVFESLFRGYWKELEKVKGGAEQNMTSMGKVYTSWPVIPNQDMGDIQYISNRIINETVEKMFSNEDLRREAWFYKFEYMRDSIDSNITQGYAYPYKYRFAKVSTDGGSDGGYFINFDQDKIWWRLADIILLRAECRARLGGNHISGAIDDLNTIRDRAKAKRYNASEYNGDLRYVIFKEKEKEFLMEGGRWYDILRNGYYRTELYGGFQKVSNQDIIDGVFFGAFDNGTFRNNTLLRQNSYWLPRM